MKVLHTSSRSSPPSSAASSFCTNKPRSSFAPVLLAPTTARVHSGASQLVVHAGKRRTLASFPLGSQTCTGDIPCHLPPSSKISVANLGDSKCVLARLVNGQVCAVALSEDHKPDRPDERQRILAIGGQVRVDETRHGFDAVNLRRVLSTYLAKWHGDLCRDFHLKCSENPSTNRDSDLHRMFAG